MEDGGLGGHMGGEKSANRGMPLIPLAPQTICGEYSTGGVLAVPGEQSGQPPRRALHKRREEVCPCPR